MSNRGKYTRMPNQRGPGQKLLNIAIDVGFLRDIDAVVAASGYAGRSQFIRDAIYEKMKRLGIELPASIKGAPPRSGTTGDSDQVKIGEGRAAVIARIASVADKMQRGNAERKRRRGARSRAPGGE